MRKKYPFVSKWKWIRFSNRRQLKHSESEYCDCNLNLFIDFYSHCCRLLDADFWREYEPNEFFFPSLNYVKMCMQQHFTRHSMNDRTLFIYFSERFLLLFFFLAFLLKWKLNNTLNNINLQRKRSKNGGKMHCIQMVDCKIKKYAPRWFLCFLLQSVSLQRSLFSPLYFHVF